jgi:phosphoribosylglycinamide formyltransferase 1
VKASPPSSSILRAPSGVSALRTTILASGGGTNVQTVIDAVAEGSLDLDLRAVIANRSDAYALERARQAGVPAIELVWDRKTTSRDAYDDRLVDLVAKTRPDLVLLLGWMHVLPVRFIERFEAILNIHPAYLPVDPSADEVDMPDGSRIPAFRGAHAVADALAAGVKWYGTSVHRVRYEIDRGEILERRALPLRAKSPDDAIQALRPAEREVLRAALRRYCDRLNFKA